MNKSFSKIRHIQNSNLLLERRFLIEQDTDTTPTNSWETMDSLIVGGPFKVMMGYGDDENPRIGYYKVGDKKHILNFNNTQFPFLTDGSILIEIAENFSKMFNPEIVTNIGEPTGNMIEIMPNSKFIIFGEDPVKKTCKIVYKNNSNQIEGKNIKMK